MPFPEIIADDNWFSITFKRKVTGAEAHDEGTKETKGETKGEIIRLLQQNPDITIPELAEKLGLSESGIEYNIRQLKKQGRIKREGSTKNGAWKVLS
ncbi:MAG: winged helix-turn-helix transcriptional regulator [Lentisphaerota bacterium]